MCEVGSAFTWCCVIARVLHDVVQEIQLYKGCGVGDRVVKLALMATL